MNHITLLLKILKPDPITLKPTKKELLRNLAQNYGFDSEKARTLVIVCLREGLIEMDNLTHRIGLTRKGYDFFNKGHGNPIAMDNEIQLNEFYSISRAGTPPSDNYQLQNLGLERVTMSGKNRESRGGGTWEVTTKVTSEDYDGVFALKVARTNPPYELDKLIDYHLNYYTEKGGSIEKFIKHMRYVALPYLHKWHSNYPAHIEFTKKWIETAEQMGIFPTAEIKNPPFVTRFEKMVNLGISPFDLRNPVYKYRSVQSAVEILQTNKIYFPTSNQLNDQLELHPSILDISFTKETKERYLKGFALRNNSEIQTMSDAQFSETILNSVSYFRNNVGIFSTGKTSTNSCLWEHYADNHKGVCLGFASPPNSFATYLSFNVHYTDQPNKIKLISNMEGKIADDIFYWFCIKHKSFSFEEEIRIIDGDGYGLRPFRKEMLFEIIMGRDTTEEDYNLVSKTLAANGYQVKRIGKIIVTPNIFGLSIENLNQQIE